MDAKTKLDVWNIDYIDTSEFQESWEEIPDEDIWEDGELFDTDVKNKIMKMMYLGEWKLIRRKQ
jgi:hypothetical protein